jgi:hypothetical protein
MVLRNYLECVQASRRGKPYLVGPLPYITNPFYAITVASQWTEEHEPPVGEAEWVRANASLMEEMGAERWLRQLLDVLEGKSDAPDVPVNVLQLRNMGSKGWLRQLLDVLGGDIVTAEEVGFAPPGGTFGYGVPGTFIARRQTRKKRKKSVQQE